MTTVAPAVASRAATPLPMPVAAPVTIATLPASGVTFDAGASASFKR